MKRLLLSLLCMAALIILYPQTVHAAAWPDNIAISAESGIVMEADSGAVLYGKNIHTGYFPASITKILTALIVIENCNMNDMVTFSHNAVYNVEAGSSSAGIDEGDQLTVRDCLYAMMLKSANEAANALAEHTAGSIDAFSAMMNAKATALGCTGSHFSNPSGLNAPDHYTTAYDMALIAQSAFQNETFAEINSALYYDLPPTKKNPDGIRVYPGHKMLKKNSTHYYPGIVGGKTGYTSLAGNTLVTCAQKNDMKLITVILNGHQTHYADTKALLDFGFSNFKSLHVADFDTTYASIENDMTIAGLPTTDLSVLHMQDFCKITLPSTAEFSNAVSSISYQLPVTAPDQAVARISYEYEGRHVGAAYLMRSLRNPSPSQPVTEISAEASPISAEDTQRADAESGTTAAETSGEAVSKPPFPISSIIWISLTIIIILAALTGLMVLLKLRMEQKEAQEQAARYLRRQQRLHDIGMSATEFNLLMQQKRSHAAKTPRQRLLQRWKRRR